MSEEEIKALNVVLDDHIDYVFDSNGLMLKRIAEVVDDVEDRKQLQEACLKQRHIACNLVGFVKQNLEQFVAFCNAQQEQIKKAKDNA